MSFRDQLISFICEDANLKASDFDDDTPLFSDGLIDSFTIASLVAFIEDRTGVRVGPGDVTLENLDGIGRILAFVDSAHKV